MHLEPFLLLAKGVRVRSGHAEVHASAFHVEWVTTGEHHRVWDDHVHDELFPQARKTSCGRLRRERSAVVIIRDDRIRYNPVFRADQKLPSSPSRTPSASRSVPIRRPEPRGTHVYVVSCPGNSATNRNTISGTAGSAALSAVKVDPRT